MWEFECSTETSASRSAVWTIWSDPERWQEFEPGVTWARLEGPFVSGAKVTVKPKGGPKSSLEIVSADPERGYATLAKLPLAKLRFEHSLADGGGRTRISSRVQVTGPLSWLFPRIFGLSKDAPLMQTNLARLAEAEEAPAA